MRRSFKILVKLVHSNARCGNDKHESELSVTVMIEWSMWVRFTLAVANTWNNLRWRQSPEQGCNRLWMTSLRRRISKERETKRFGWTRNDKKLRRRRRNRDKRKSNRE